DALSARRLSRRLSAREGPALAGRLVPKGGDATQDHGTCQHRRVSRQQLRGLIGIFVRRRRRRRLFGRGRELGRRWSIGKLVTNRCHGVAFHTRALTENRRSPSGVPSPTGPAEGPTVTSR